VLRLSLRERGRSSTIRGELGVEPLLLHIERSQLRWFLWLGWRPRVRTRTFWRDYISHLVWEHLGTPQEELGRGAGFNSWTCWF